MNGLSALIANTNLWAMEPQRAMKYLEIVEEIEGKTKAERGEAGEELSNSKINAVQYVTRGSGEKLLYSESPKRNSVAIISANGPIMKRATMFESVSGLTSCERINRELEEAGENPDIVGVVIKGYSPGGSVDGVENCSDNVWNFAKPVVGYVEDLAASAMFWIMSGSDKIFASGKTAQIGSIGVILTHNSRAEYYARIGQKYTFITNADAENKTVGNPATDLSETDKEYLRVKIEPTALTFQAHVIRGREKINQEVAFNGGIWSGEEAIELGLVDAIGSLDNAIQEVYNLNSENSNTIKMSQKGQAAIKADEKNGLEVKAESDFWAKMKAKFGLDGAAKEETAKEEVKEPTQMERIESMIAGQNATIKANAENISMVANGILNLKADLLSAKGEAVTAEELALKSKEESEKANKETALLRDQVRANAGAIPNLDNKGGDKAPEAVVDPVVASTLDAGFDRLANVMNTQIKGV